MCTSQILGDLKITRAYFACWLDKGIEKSDEDHGPWAAASWCPSIQHCNSTVVNLVLKGYHSPLNWLFVPKNNDRTLTQYNECYTLRAPWCQREKWHFWGENVRQSWKWRRGKKKLVILQNSLEKNLGDDPPQWLKIAQNIAFLQLLEKYKKLLECRSQPNFSDSNLRFS